MNIEQPLGDAPKKRRERYRGTHPRFFNQKYKELNPEQYAQDVQKVKSRGQTPAGTHIPIMMQEILDFLNPQPGQIGLDATLGYGGHSSQLLARVQPTGKLFCTDVDPIELPKTEARLRALGYPDHCLSVHKSNYAGIQKILPLAGDGFDFILADLGLSSMQIDNPERGFTFKVAGPLDLRLNPERGLSAADFLARARDEEILVKILIQHSDEFYAKIIAKTLFERRNELRTTTALASAVRDALEPIELDEEQITRSIKRTFQAIRISVNDEFSALDSFLRALPVCLKSGGKVAIMSFHSGEDNRVRRALEMGLESGLYSAISTESIRAGSQERYDNPRSKPAHLRWAVRA